MRLFRKKVRLPAPKHGVGPQRPFDPESILKPWSKCDDA